MQKPKKKERRRRRDSAKWDFEKKRESKQCKEKTQI
jgi:hypothetical protein